MCREVEIHGQDYRQSSVREDQVSAPQRGKGSDVGERRALTLKAGQGMAILIPRTAIEPLMILTGAGGANEIAVAVDDTRICLSGGARQLSRRGVTGNFPDFEAVSPTGQGTHRRPPTLAARD